MRAVGEFQPRPYTRLQGTGTIMRYEVVEEADAWIVRSEGSELARYADQESALHDVADRLRGAGSGEPAALSVRFQARTS